MLNSVDAVYLAPQMVTDILRFIRPELKKIVGNNLSTEESWHDEIPPEACFDSPTHLLGFVFETLMKKYFQA